MDGIRGSKYCRIMPLIRKENINLAQTQQLLCRNRNKNALPIIRIRSEHQALKVYPCTLIILTRPLVWPLGVCKHTDTITYLSNWVGSADDHLIHASVGQHRQRALVDVHDWVVESLVPARHKHFLHCHQLIEQQIGGFFRGFSRQHFFYNCNF